jgi:hypothetical protein
MGLIHVPQSKWGSGTGRQVILKSDFEKVEGALLEAFDLTYCPDLVWVDATQVKIPATADCKARVVHCGFPSPLHRGLFVDGGLSDGKYRELSADVVMDFDTPSNLWGNEKTSQWYVIYALAASADTTFTLKAMPVMRFSSQVAQVITLRNCGNSGDIGYGLSTNELANSKLLVFSGASKGQIRTITANNNDNGTAGTVTYSGTALTLAQGDWVMVLPNTNFRYLGMIFNDDSSNIVRFNKCGNQVVWNTFIEIVAGAINGYTAQDLGLKVPPTARRLLGEATATGGTDVKLGISYDGTNAALVVHGSAPSGNFQSLRGAIPFACHLLDGNRIYLNNENTGNQSVRAVGWEE